jgi:NAD(P)-dependent dehydrogenase (short-subunit alcohol dehydrogenase family)
MPVIAVAGNGPRLRSAIAEVFGTQGYKVALLSHDRGELQPTIAELAKHGIDAAGFSFNVLDRGSVASALAAVKERFGPIDVLEFSAADAALPLSTGLTLDEAQVWIDYYLRAAAATVNAVLPDMLARGSGTILFTTGVSSAYPELDQAAFANFGLLSADLRNWARSMHATLASKGVQVGYVRIGAYLGHQSRATPEAIAPLYWELHTHRDQFEKEFMLHTMDQVSGPRRDDA